MRNKWMAILASLAGLAAAASADIWSQDFEAIAIGTGSPGNSVLASTKFAPWNAVNGTNIAATADFTAIDATNTKVVELTDDGNDYDAFRILLGDYINTSIAPGSELTMTFDYVAAAGTLGAVQFRTDDGTGTQRIRENATLTSTTEGNVVHYTATYTVPTADNAGGAIDDFFAHVSFNNVTGNQVIGYVDNFTVIPEPATIGLIGAFGGAILFIRRRMAL